VISLEHGQQTLLARGQQPLADTVQNRAALEHDVLATVCFYGTGIHDGRLGLDKDAGSLERAGEIRGELLMVFGSEDPHVPSEGRKAIDRKLKSICRGC
jgi:dienelactone hydrolase